MSVSDKANTLRAQDHGHPPVICLHANGIDRCDTAGCNGCGWSEGGVSYTLNTIDHHAVCYEISAGAVRNEYKDICQTLRSRMGTGEGNVPLALIWSNHEESELPDTLGCTEQTDIHR